MAKLYISEYANLAQFSGAVPPIAPEPSPTTQVVDFSGGVTSSAVFSTATRFVRLHTDAICSFRFGGSAATTSYPRMAADATARCRAGIKSGKAVISNT
jgi:hypothetical protein